MLQELDVANSEYRTATVHGKTKVGEAVSQLLPRPVFPGELSYSLQEADYAEPR